MQTISARSRHPATASADAPATLHLLWRTGVGMAAWIDDGEVTELAEPLADALHGRRFRREIAIVDAAGRRRFVAAATLGLTSAVAVLDA